MQLTPEQAKAVESLRQAVWATCMSATEVHEEPSGPTFICISPKIRDLLWDAHELAEEAKI